MSSDNDSSPRRSASKSPKKNNFSSIISQKLTDFQLESLNRNNSYKVQSPSQFIQNNQIQKQKNKNKSISIINDTTSLQEQNKKLRKKLKQLSQRLDQQLQRAAQNKLKMQNLLKLNHPIKQQTTNLQLQNAYKIIQRLQKSVKDFQNKQSYQISVKRIMDLQSIIKKKQKEIEQFSQQIKTNKKIIRQKEKHINELLENSKKNVDLTEDKDLIERMKRKVKKLTQENDLLRKKQLSKHQQLVKAQRKIIQMEQDEQIPIGKEQILVKQLQQFKKKYKQAMTRIEKQNTYITRLNQRIDKQGSYSSKGRKSQSDKDRRNISKSLEQLPALNHNKIKVTMNLLDHIPSPKVPIKLKRY